MKVKLTFLDDALHLRMIASIVRADGTPCIPYGYPFDYIQVFSRRGDGSIIPQEQLYCGKSTRENLVGKGIVLDLPNRKRKVFAYSVDVTSALHPAEEEDLYFTEATDGPYSRMLVINEELLLMSGVEYRKEKYSEPTTYCMEPSAHIGKIVAVRQSKLLGIEFERFETSFHKEQKEVLAEYHELLNKAGKARTADEAREMLLQATAKVNELEVLCEQWKSLTVEQYLKEKASA